MLFRKRVAFGVIYGLILVIATAAGIEALASFYAPPWPARALRSVALANPVTASTKPSAGQSPLSPSLNSWGMRDVERTVAKPAGATPRIVFVGDSFVESASTPLSLPAAVERRVAATGGTIEAINLGISGTDPRSYYYRLRDVAMKLSPDALFLFIYTGNDIVAADNGYSVWPSLVDESPGSALLGTVMPRTNWLLVNRLRLSEFLRGQPSPPGESKMLYDVLHAPPGERLQRLVVHVRKYYYPDLSEAEISEVLSRGDDRFWREAEHHEGEQEDLVGWMLNILVGWETGTVDIVKSREDAARLAGGGRIEATLSWIEAADRVAREHKVPLMVFLAPGGSVDPAYAEFWKPWPRAYSWNNLCDEWQSRLAAALDKTKIRFVDLRDDLNGIPDTYRTLDGHWTQKGEAIVADRIRREVGRLVSQ
jgi:hypothetical protein